MKRVIFVLIFFALVQSPRILRYWGVQQRQNAQAEIELRRENAPKTATKQDDCVVYLTDVLYIAEHGKTETDADLASGLYRGIPSICDGWQYKDSEAMRLLADLDAIVK